MKILKILSGQMNHQSSVNHISDFVVENVDISQNPNQGNNYESYLSMFLLLWQRPKHPVKVHVWAGMSWEGPTSVIIFEGKMNAAGFIQVLDAGLIPFTKIVIRNPRLMMDNDPKHTSRQVEDWLQNEDIN